MITSGSTKTKKWRCNEKKCTAEDHSIKVVCGLLIWTICFKPERISEVRHALHHASSANNQQELQKKNDEKHHVDPIYQEVLVRGIPNNREYQGHQFHSWINGLKNLL